MPYVDYNNIILCIPQRYRFRLDNGEYVYMEWHSHCGPSFFYDKKMIREIDGWWENNLICRALEWFVNRSYIA